MSAPAALHQVAYLLLLLLGRVQAVVKVSSCGNDFRAFAAQRAGFFFSQRLRFGLVECGTRHNTSQLSARVCGFSHQRGALLRQLVTKYAQTLLLRVVQVQLFTGVFNHFYLPGRHVGFRHIAAKSPMFRATRAGRKRANHQSSA